jgi:hypothetical protein
MLPLYEPVREHWLGEQLNVLLGPGTLKSGWATFAFQQNTTAVPTIKVLDSISNSIKLET